MKTRLMKAARVASAVAFVLCLALCAGSFFVTVYRVSPDWGGQVVIEGVSGGGLFLCHSLTTNFKTVGWVVDPHGASHVNSKFFGHPLWDGPLWDLWLPLWVPLCLFGVLPAFGIAGRLRERRKASKVGFCARCGYDLRATPERCPECGTACGAGGGGN